MTTRRDLVPSTPPHPWVTVLSRDILLEAPLDLAATVAPLRVGLGDPTVRISHDVALLAWRTRSGPVSLRLQHRGDRLSAEAAGPGAEEAMQDAAGLAGLEDAPESLVTDHPLLHDIQRRNPGLRLPRTGRVTDVLVPTILGQKVTGIEQKRAWAALVRRHGEPAPGPWDLRLAPSAEEIAAIPYFRWHPLGVERRRADTIRRVCSRAVRVEETLAMSAGDAERRLSAFPGVGPWTTRIVRRLSTGDPDSVETGDYNLPNLVSWNLAGEPRGDDTRMLELLEPFTGQRARVVRLLEVGGDRPPRYGPRFAPRELAGI